MSELLFGILGLVVMFVAMILRMPVGMAMLVVGFFGTWALNGERSAMALLVTETYSSISNYSLLVIPMFLLMGNIASVAGFSRGLYEAAFAWVGGFRGGLASASVLGCAAFSAVSGSSVATAVTIGRAALPEMKRFHYADHLAAGSVAAGGTLGFLIPPSTGFVIYAILTEESIGQLFMAGILPGILLTALFILAIVLITTLNPAAGPRNEQMSWPARWKALSGALPLLVVIVISIGGIYVGAFTPVEASGIGAILVIGLAAIAGKLSWRTLFEAGKDTINTSAMLFLIVVGASVLNPFLSFTHLPEALGNALQATHLGPFGILLLIIVFYLILGMFMDGLAMLVVTVPIFFPVVTGLGFDPIWYGVVSVIAIEMGMITPPVGLNVFVVKSIAQDVPMAEIFKGVMPFWVAMALCLLFIVVFPQIALLIPQTMFK
ncbi:MAG: TRAP transporter large permease [Thiothrix sp.]|nr:TRAP transporter large permease [Thiothrix sp.]HPQ95593.1 TRAP transporter large permease [Thiolinea sp.]